MRSETKLEEEEMSVENVCAPAITRILEEKEYNLNSSLHRSIVFSSMKTESLILSWKSRGKEERDFYQER